MILILDISVWYKTISKVYCLSVITRFSLYVDQVKFQYRQVFKKGAGKKNSSS